MMDFPIWLIPCDACSGVAKWKMEDLMGNVSSFVVMGVCSGDVFPLY
jgi:hypothetical protein